MTQPSLALDDIRFLDSLANRLSEVLYNDNLYRYGRKDEPPTLTHDDYDRLRKITKAAKLADWERQHPEPSVVPGPA